MARVEAVAGIERGLTALLRSGEFPDADDIEGVTQALARIAFTYNLGNVGTRQRAL